MNPLINIVTALHCEAKPLIDHFNLKKIMHVDLPFSLFVNKEKSIYLIISGVGKIKMAIATTFLYMWTGGKRYSCFINIGIAGSGHFSVGDILVAHKITEASTGRAWYPFVSSLKYKQQTVLFTHDVPQNIYPSVGMVDMEASAFFQTAASFVSQEHIQVVKIISDNDVTSQQEINENNIKELISKKLDNIVGIIHHLMALSQQESEIEKVDDRLKKFQNQWHFTQAQLIQLKECLRRWQFQIKDDDPLDFCQNEKNASNAINKLIEKLDIHENNLC